MPTVRGSRQVMDGEVVVGAARPSSGRRDEGETQQKELQTLTTRLKETTKEGTRAGDGHGQGGSSSSS